jgi:hypothetical protein
MLMPDQRALLVRHCYDHPVAVCPECSRSLTFDRIVADIVMGKRDVCSVCRADVTMAVLHHLAECTVMRAQQREASERANDTTPKGVEPHDARSSDETLTAQHELQALREKGQDAIGKARRDRQRLHSDRSQAFASALFAMITALLTSPAGHARCD